MSTIGTTGYTVLNEDAESYSVIRPAEVCSVETAKSLGLLDKKHYYKGIVKNDVRTYSPNVKRDAERPYSLCKETVGDGFERGTDARPLCSLIAPGLIPKGENGDTCGRPDGECPPGFSWDARAKTCRKPLREVKQPRTRHCSAQWHDWFTVPNWGFKNGFEMIDGKCYEPCPEDTLPIRGRDPVTGESRGTDNIKRCVDKLEYLGGKYGNEPNYCNLSWIKRLSAKLPDIAKEHTQKFPLFAVNGSEALDQASKEGVIDILKETLKSPENLSAHTEITDGICARNVDTPERLKEAYDICENIHRDPIQAENQYVQDMTKTLSLMNPNIKPAALREDILNRFAILKQACHYTFCDDNDSNSQRASTIGKSPLCFKADDIKRIALKEKDALSVSLEAQPGDYPEQTTDKAPSASNHRVVQNAVRRIAHGLIYLVIAICVVMGLWLCISAFLPMGNIAELMRMSSELKASTDATMAALQSGKAQK